VLWIPAPPARTSCAARVSFAAARFFAGKVLPEITATRGVLAHTSTALLDPDDEAF
jgi:hypothetical protein